MSAVSTRDLTDDGTAPGAEADRWCAVLDGPLPVDQVHRWVVRPDCGAVVVFTGNARDHSPGRPGVDVLTYESYPEAAVPRLDAVADEVRRRWPGIRRIALLHRVGSVPIGEEAVVVGVSSPHRGEAFEAARFGIDALKASVPIWKRERWAGGESWGLEAQHLVDPSAVIAVPVGRGGDPGDRP
jgi:molybdopterin synthase catalytic subunit